MSSGVETVTATFRRAVERFSARPALALRGEGGWRATSWREYGRQVDEVAAGLVGLGVEPGTGVAILSANRPEWAIADFAAIAAGAIPTGVFVTNSPEQCAYVIDHSAAQVAIVDTPQALAKLLAVRDRLPQLRSLVLLDGASEAPGVLGWEELTAAGGEVERRELERRVAAQHPDDVATLIYTSGTTGTPKGVELTHRNMTWTAESAVRHDLRVGEAERQVSYLPLSHVAEQMISLHLPLQYGGALHFVPALEELARALSEVRPTIFFAVPRVWEKLQAAVETAIESAPPLRRRLVHWAMRKGLAAGYTTQRGGRASLAFGLADRLVLSSVRARLGLDRASHCASAAAPISLATLEFFLSLGIPILEIYGLSETCGPGTVSRAWHYRTGRVGAPMTGVDVAIADDGEVLMRGPNIFRGYRSDPEGTRAVLDAEGWFHSGDIGAIDEEGFLRITDRKKELLVTSGGKKVAPAPIEGRLREILGVEHAVLIGEQRNYVTALLTLDPTRLPQLAARIGSAARTLAEAAVCPRVRAFFEREVERVNAALARFESVRRFVVLPDAFSIDGGELTPTLKLKRRVILSKYAQFIERLYTGGG